jgi:hypothetical protein
MDIGSAFTYMFEDENWIKKILIGGIVSLIPIVNFAALGYVVQVIRNVRDGRAVPLPEWDQFGEYFKSGLFLGLIYLVYLIPIFILSCVQGAVPALLESAGGEDIATVLSIVLGCVSCLMGVWGLLVGIMFPAIMVRFADVGTFGSGFQFGDILAIIKANIGSYIIVLLLSWVASGIIAPLGLILCVVGVIFTVFWAYLVTGNLVGQYAAQIRQQTI